MEYRIFIAMEFPKRESCLVLDISLPVLNGLELQKRVAAERTDMTIIFITGYGDVPDSPGHEGGGRRNSNEAL